MTLSERMIEETRTIWDSYLEHPFVQGIAGGTLEKEKFRYYMIQDYKYLIEYGKVFALGFAKAGSAESRQLFARYIDVLTNTEMDTHRGYFGVFGIDEAEIERTPMSLSNISYTSYMLKVAYEEDEAAIMAAILSCAVSYQHIAEKLIAADPDCVKDDFYGSWIASYASEEYAEENRLLMAFMDRLGEGKSEKVLDHLVEIFRISSLYEKAFWDMSWKMGD